MCTKYLNAIKHIVYILLFGVLSCNSDEFLEEKPLDFLSPENTYDSPENIRLAINSLYRKSSVDVSLGENNHLHGIMSDASFCGENPAATQYIYSTAIIPTSSVVSDLWKHLYSIVNEANLIIYYINNSSDDMWKSEQQRLQYQAEACFFRAWSYRLLASYYGDVPLVKEPITYPKTDFTRTPVAEVYALIEEDLNFSTMYLVDPKDSQNGALVSKGAAWHLLAEVYLAEKKYEDAVDAATKVITGFDYSLMTERFGNTNDVFGSGDVFLDLFAYGNHSLAENKEGIWITQFAANITGAVGNPGPAQWGPAYHRIGNDPDGFPVYRGELYNGAYTGYTDTLGRPVAWNRPTYHTSYEIWKSDWDNDIRNASPHNIYRTFYFSNPESPWFGKKIDFSLWGSYESSGRNAMRDTCQYIFPYWIGKAGDPCHVLADAARSGGGDTFKDRYAMRLAETYLYRAEAYIQLGKLELAAADINVVRQRAKAKPVSAADVTIDYLLDERTRELYTEEFRDLVLRRTGKLVERVRKYNNNPYYQGIMIKEHNVLWPIPQTEIDLNVDGELTQNPGYN